MDAAQFILDCFPVAVSDHGLLGCLAFVLLLTGLIGAPISAALLGITATPPGR